MTKRPTKARLTVYAAFLVVSSTSCGEDVDRAAFDEPTAARTSPAAFAPKPDALAVDGARMRGAAQGRAEAAPDRPADEGGRMIAFIHGLELSAPGAAVPELAEAHAEACRAAGFDLCEITALTITPPGEREDGAHAHLSLKAVPNWLDEFRDRIVGDVAKAGGRVVRRSTNAQDLTGEIVDVEARMDVQKALRTRLTALLERPNASVEDLVRVERELARVQATIDAQAARARAMRGRVEKSRLDVTYGSLALAPDPPGPMDRLWREIRAFLDAFLTGLRVFAFSLAFAAPWALAGWPLIRWVLRRRKARAAARAAEAT